MLPRLLSPQTPPPLDDQLIRERLQAAGYQIRVGEKGKYYRRLIQLMGGYENMEWLFDEVMLRLCFDAQIRKGRAYTLGELKGIAQPQEATPQFYSQFQMLVEQKLFFRGYNLTCPYCNLTAWYRDLSEEMTCCGCAAIFQPPLEIPFAFKPNHLLTENLKNGAITVLLFLHQLRSVSKNALWEADYILTKNGQTVELDLVTLIGDVLTVVECKDDFSDGLEQQLNRSLEAAHTIGAEAFIFATLQPKNPLPHFFEAEDNRLLRRWMGQRALLDSLAYWKQNP